MRSPYRPSIFLNCSVCNKSFKIKQSAVDRGKGLYCSRNCYFTQKRLENSSKCVVCLKIKADWECRVSKLYCRNCWRKDLFSRHPENLEKRKIKSLIKYRKENGLPLDTPKRSRNPDGYISTHGYKVLYIDEHPNCYRGSEIFEHTFVMSNHLRRPLAKGENIHHKNGIKLDNRIENLELWTRKQPPGQRISDLIKYYREFIEFYGGKVDLSTVPEVFYNDET